MLAMGGTPAHETMILSAFYRWILAEDHPGHNGCLLVGVEIVKDNVSCVCVCVCVVV